MRTMLTSTIILFTTILSSVAIGVGAGYAAIWAILAAFGHRHEPAVVRVEATAEPLPTAR